MAEYTIWKYKDGWYRVGYEGQTKELCLGFDAVNDRLTEAGLHLGLTSEKVRLRDTRLTLKQAYRIKYGQMGS